MEGIIFSVEGKRISLLTGSFFRKLAGIGIYFPDKYIFSEIIENKINLINRKKLTKLKARPALEKTVNITLYEFFEL